MNTGISSSIVSTLKKGTYNKASNYITTNYTRSSHKIKAYNKCVTASKYHGIHAL